MKAVIIEDEQKSRDMLADILKKNFPQITILGLAKNVAEGVEFIQALKPNLLFLDISMPAYEEKGIFSGEDLAKLLKEYMPKCKIILLTIYLSIICPQINPKCFRIFY